MVEMTVVNEQAVLEQLKTVMDPEIHKDIVSMGMIKNVAIKGSDVSLTVELTTPACPLRNKIEFDIREALRRISGMGNIAIEMTGRVHSKPEKNALPGVKHIVAVGSGKGGVGKSTVAVNTALSLARDGAAVGLLDADVYGPNIPTMLGVHEPEEIRGNTIIPPVRHGVKILSMGFFLEPNQPVIWRGPMLHNAVRQFLYDVEWGELDYLVIDLPPGTGDVQLSMSQMIPVTGAVIVATPQAVAMEDAAKAFSMLQKVKIDVLGVVENMAYLICPHCSERIEPFGYGGTEAAAERWGVRFLGRLPLDPAVRIGGDSGKPVTAGESESAEAFRNIARNIAGEISTRVYA